VIGLIALGLAAVALYGYQLAGTWRRVYVVAPALALSLSVFPAVMQFFDKTPAPRPSWPPS
jgi:hypothetical protein